MDQKHITEEVLQEALGNYRWSLTDALQEAGSDASREDVIVQAREILGEDDPDQRDLIEALANSENGDPVWSLEEEIIDDVETVASGEDAISTDASAQMGDESGDDAAR